MAAEWLKTAVFYEIYPQSFMDSNGDGIGDFNGITEKLDYIKELGCNAIWMNPCFDSPFKDAGYDVRDYRKVAERYGTIEDLQRLFEAAHERGIHILLDLVPGHTSEEHAWFRESGREERNECSDRYIWTNGWLERPEGIGYIAGERERNGVYITNFFKCQPALNYGFLKRTTDWQKPIDDPACLATRAAMAEVMRYWLGLGCDGFRVDMADSLVKNDDEKKSGTCEVWRDIIGQVKRDYPDAVLVSEWNNPASAIGMAGFDMDFFLDWTGNGYNLLMRDYDDTGRDGSFFKRDSGRSITDFLDEYLPKYEAVRDRGFYCLITGNHDTIRAAYHLDERELKLTYSFLLTMPGVPFIYYGDEIGMKYQMLSSKEGGYTRTGSRTPMQWDDSLNHGFSKAEPSALYLPTDSGADTPTVQAQRERADSLYHTVRELLRIRRENGDFAVHDNLRILAARRGERGFAYERGSLIMLCNPAGRPTTLAVDISGAEQIYAVGSCRAEDGKCVLAAQSFVIYARSEPG